MTFGCKQSEYDGNIIVQPDGENFSWPYIYNVKKNLRKNKKAYILIRSNNSGFPSCSYEEIKKNAIDKFEYFPPLFSDLNVICMQPIFPRFDIENLGFDLHSMDRNSVIITESLYKRIDLQLIAMIDDLKNRLSEKYRIEVEDKVLLYGFSASANFADRFSIIHPSIVEAVAIGGNNEYLLPVQSWNNENLPFPLGLYDFEKLFKKIFEEEEFRNVKRYIFRGENDLGGEWIEEVNGELIRIPYYEYLENTYKEKFDNDVRTTVFGGENYNEFDSQLILYRINGNTFNQIETFRNTGKIFKDLKMMNTEFVLYGDIGHKVNDEILSDLVSFFSNVIDDSDY